MAAAGAAGPGVGEEDRRTIPQPMTESESIWRRQSECSEQRVVEAPAALEVLNGNAGVVDHLEKTYPEVHESDQDDRGVHRK